MPDMPSPSDCPCGSSRAYDVCCGPLITGLRPAPTPEALMRSRYTAYVKAQFQYLRKTLAPSEQDGFDEEAARRWSTESEWRGLAIVETEGGGAGDDEGTVSFVARYAQKGEEREHRELAVFRRDPKTRAWYFAEARAPKGVTVVREAAKVGRNDPCSCGSGKKFKKCHGA